MGKYSSDSESSDVSRSRRSKRSSHKGRSRSTSSESGHRRVQPRHKKRCKGRRSHSKDRYSKSRRHGGKSRRTTSSDSSSDDSKRKTRRSPVSSSSATNSSCAVAPQVTPEVGTASTAEQLRAKVQKAIQAARSADNLLRQRRGEVLVLEGGVSVSMPQPNMLEDINAEGFVQRTFTSSASAPRASLPDIPLPVLVDLTEEPKMPAGGDLGVMSPVLLEDQEGRQQRWVKKLFTLRQRALHGEPMVT